MKVLLSIKPEFAFKIFNGTKRYEFRKSVFKRSGITTVVVYASSPVQKVIGEFTIERILGLDKQRLWQRTRVHSGISKEHFERYYSSKRFGYAIKIRTLRKYPEPLCLRRHFNIATPPQSYQYLTE